MNEFTQGPLTLLEMRKILSLFENPPEADGVRRALRFYEIPEPLRTTGYKWGTTEDLRRVLDHYAFPQSQREIDWMLQYVKDAGSLLEIGSSFGGTLEAMAGVMRKGSKIVSVDLACDATPKFLNPTDSLKDACRRIGQMGGNVELFVGDSHSPKVVDAVSGYAPFDFIFIDGDHSYEGIKADWENYGPMGSIVGFHDIAGGEKDCRRFWEELKASGEYRTEECIEYPGGSFGIGIVFRDG